MKTKFPQRKVISIATKLRQLKHRNTVNVKGYSIRPTALIFELCFFDISNMQISNLTQLIYYLNKENNCSYSERLNNTYQSSNGIMYLHECGIIHRDMKPSNLFVTGTTKDIIIKVSDFDDLVDNKVTIALTMTKQKIYGITLAYIFLAIIKSEIKEPNLKSDIYALAITAFMTISNFSSA
ncbi:probable myosin light chain kinase DDB_G0275057 [Hydra vulgaris]|uniref:Probable myosin light chain kinase DDB_G0275057 n=1 Tax=Hydra vulgaris TaxID=6087 RepID=A0ABM4B162_HYDVU